MYTILIYIIIPGACGGGPWRARPRSLREPSRCARRGSRARARGPPFNNVVMSEELPSNNIIALSNIYSIVNVVSQLVGS